MTEDADDILKRLPARLKEARRAQGLSLDAVAKLSGVSRSMVSQIERGESSPTIATLWNLTRALQVDFAGLLDTQGGPGIEVLRAKDTPTIDNRGNRCRLRILSPPEEAGRHEVYDLSLGTGGSLISEPHTKGAREHLTVIDGRIEVTAGDRVEVIAAGDTARYPADVAHALRALDLPARAFLVVQDA
ncbi:XRE family transcriptional regulator [Aestuariicoccus sp. MJ-SS9]|uniref:helix-turn-helix domain-containing protein n=1 Tax=Aestuariicoccus sp. MJ-SS9 TaxID=3079855 RepID=UPI002912035C|nr:XRE family transcriptional regulator [Aestuariicoccus sp. MJ-SS9]MDU8913579.1 XRE family transcriptional regulator [Aestuariicoccus sp. MJ-SS9]